VIYLRQSNLYSNYLSSKSKAILSVFALAALFYALLLSSFVVFNKPSNEAIAGETVPARTQPTEQVKIATGKQIVASKPVGKKESAVKQPGKTAQASTPDKINFAVRNGDTMLSMLTDRGIPQEEAIDIVQTMKKLYNPARLSVGQSLEINFDKKRKTSINNLSIAVSPLKTISIYRTAKNSFAGKEVKSQLFVSTARAGGVINSSLYQTAVNSGLPSSMISEVINALSYDVDFQRDIHEGDEIDVVFERLHTDKNVTAGYGKILYISLKLDDRELTLYRHISKEGFAGYYNAKGESVKKALLKTPINGANITSSFGMRMHPILGYSKMHKGVDFGALTGTPIYAAGDGIVEEAGRKGGYGNYVRVKHSSSYATAYAHTSRFAKGIKTGAKVKQGQVIAYVGSTGSSTGPHLHYEVLQNGNHVNPSGVKFRTGQTLGGREMAEFKKNLQKVKTALATLPRKNQVALARN